MLLQCMSHVLFFMFVYNHVTVFYIFSFFFLLYRISFCICSFPTYTYVYIYMYTLFFSVNVWSVVGRRVSFNNFHLLRNVYVNIFKWASKVPCNIDENWMLLCLYVSLYTRMYICIFTCSYMCIHVYKGTIHYAHNNVTRTFVISKRHWYSAKILMLKAMVTALKSYPCKITNYFLVSMVLIILNIIII